MKRIKVTISKPNKKQDIFLAEEHRHVAYGGARGGGKSWAVRAKAKLMALAWPGIEMIIIRRTYQELTRNHINRLKIELKGLAKYNKQEKVFNFDNGSKLFFGYCDNDGDAEQYQGAEYDVIFIDEACNLKEEWIKKIIACNRSDRKCPKRMYYTLNPGGVSHAYFKRLFIDRVYKDGETPEEYAFVQALVTDNEAMLQMSPDYLKQLEALPPKLRAAWLEGRWDIFAGQFFEEFVSEPNEDGVGTHVIPAMSEIPVGWKIYRSYDWGYNKPFSCGWWAVDYEGRFYRILELYGCKRDEPNEGIHWTPDEQFKEIARVEREHKYLKGKRIVGVADPSIWDASKGESVAETARRHGINFEPGDNERIAGWMQCHYRLSFDENGRPMMYVFDNCKDFIRTIPTLMYDDHKVEDVDSDGEDHIADEWRYFCMMRPLSPRKVESKRTAIFNDPLELLSRRRRY